MLRSVVIHPKFICVSLVEDLLFACSLASNLLRILHSVDFTNFSYITTRNMARNKEAQALVYYFLEHLERRGFDNVSCLRQQYNDYNDIIKKAA